MRTISTLASVLFISTSAFAAKIHRDSKKELVPKITETAKQVKSHCGCSPKIDVDWKKYDKSDAKNAFDLKRNMGWEMDAIVSTTKEFCSDAESKKLFCSNLKSIVIVPVDGDYSSTKLEERSKTVEINTTRSMGTGGTGLKKIMEEW